MPSTYPSHPTRQSREEADTPMISVPIEAHRQFLLKDFSPKAYKVICEMLVSLPCLRMRMNKLNSILMHDRPDEYCRVERNGSVTSIILGSEPTIPLILMLCPPPSRPHA